jgi:hypothetical protein
MKVDGACHCGAIALEAEVDPSGLAICHCADCQSLSGSAYRANIQARSADFRLTRGTPKIYVKTAESGNRRAQAFCGECGSQLYACAPENPTTYSLRVGTLRQRHELKPTRQIWLDSAVPWSATLEAVPGAPRQS